MAYRWSVVLALIAVAALTGCTVTTAVGELTAGDCSDGEDNDHDGLTDCADLDCQAFEGCARLPAAVPPIPDAATRIGDAYVEIPEAGPSAPPPPSQPDATTPPTHEPPAMPNAPDMPEPPANSTCTDTGDCAANETCVKGYCLNDDFVVVELWDITRITARVPRSVGSESDYACLDTDDCLLEFIGIPPYRDCRCRVDPKVQVFVDHLKDGVDAELAGETPARRKKDTGVWSAPDITLRLLPDSTIIIRVLDADDGEDQLLYECEFPAGPVLEGKPMECVHRFPPDASEPVEFKLTATVGPTQVP